MKRPPGILGGARVVLWSALDARHRATGKCRHILPGTDLRPTTPAGLAICQSEGEHSFHLFACDAEWNTITDTWHATLQEARDQAEFEYEGISQTWNPA